MKRKAVFAGSFDPFTKGHESIVLKSLQLFDEIIICIAINSSKNEYFSVDKRENWIKTIFKKNKKIIVKSHKGLIVDFCEENNIKFMIRGLRNSLDFNYEKDIANMNHSLNDDITTLFIMSNPEFSHISSTLIKDIMKNSGDISPFIPKQIKISNIN